LVERFRVRLAQPSDGSELAALRYAFRRTVGEPVESEDAFVARSRPWMEQRLSPSSAWKAWIAEGDEGLWGHVWLQIVEKIPNPVDECERHAYLTNFFVRPAYRDRGVGTQLLETCLDWAKQNDVDAVFLWPTDDSRSLYERHGFRESSRVLLKSLG
jgi:GNAT superfamily N-acetyltransferase